MAQSASGKNRTGPRRSRRVYFLRLRGAALFTAFLIRLRGAALFTAFRICLRGAALFTAFLIRLRGAALFTAFRAGRFLTILRAGPFRTCFLRGAAFLGAVRTVAGMTCAFWLATGWTGAASGGDASSRCPAHLSQHTISSFPSISDL
jgi:hypothetical protein